MFCKYVVGRGLTERFEFAIALAEGVALDPEVLAETFSKYSDTVRAKKDSFGKKVSPLLVPPLCFPWFENK